MAEGEKHGMVDLEKELTCSICTDILYQPLTLLDCLHTFCGACLKEWFQFQASTATSLHPYTCPSCRSPVRDTKPNATVTTLLDMFLQANPNRGKSQEERATDRQKYKPGDNVLPKLRRRPDPGAEEERRLIEEAQQLSLREVGINNGNDSATLEPPRERRRRERSRDRSRDSRHTEGRRSRDPSRNPPETRTPVRREVPARQIEHQSSLRSLLSASDLDSQEIEEEIMRQIMEEGLLDGIDLNNIDMAQEDEISERIAEAYRRRQRERQRERRERRERQAREARPGSSRSSPPPSREGRTESRTTTPRNEEPPRRRPQGRPVSGTATPQNGPSNRPPVSRPDLMDAANRGGRAHHRRTSSQGSNRSSRRADPPASLAITSERQASRSANDISERPSTGNGEGRRRRLSESRRSASEAERQQFRSSLMAHPSSNPNSPRRTVFHANSESPTAVTPPATASTPPTLPPPAHSRRTTDPGEVRQTRPTNNESASMGSPQLGVPRSTTEPPRGRTRASSTGATSTATLYPEPDISCGRCGKLHIEYDVHYNCSRCDGGNFNLCLSCYRYGKGCKHWFGFGWAAWPRYERQAPPGGYPPNHEHPHILVGHKYRRPERPVEPTSTSARGMTDENPALRLEAGVFCDICNVFANACYWKCDMCNEGAWGFCNDCVNQGRHCTHPLLPITHKPSQSSKHHPEEATAPTSAPGSPQPDTTHRAAPLSPGLAPPGQDVPCVSPPLTPKSASLVRGPGVITIANALFRPLTFTTFCNICTYPIPPSHTRFHCPKCQYGDYDICTSCYLKLVPKGQMSAENGPNGWRKCLNGHRMVVVGFEDRDGGQRRVVTREAVGGLRVRDEDIPDTSSSTANPPHSPAEVYSWTESGVRKTRSPLTSSGSTSAARFPPDGGTGLRIQAYWGYYPEEGVKDELMFPKFAEIREAEDINGDWFWGVYAGARGLFPGNYGKIVGGTVGR